MELTSYGFVASCLGNCSECASKGHPRMASRDLHEKCFEAGTAYEPSKVT